MRQLIVDNRGLSDEWHLTDKGIDITGRAVEPDFAKDRPIERIASRHRAQQSAEPQATERRESILGSKGRPLS